MGRSILLALLLGCAPEVPDRSCSDQEDCFTQEICVSGQCVTATAAASKDAGLPDVAEPETTDGGPDTGPVP